MASSRLLVQSLREFYVKFCEFFICSLSTMTITTGIPNTFGPQKSPTNLPSTPENELKRLVRSNLEEWGFFSLKQVAPRGWHNDIQTTYPTMITHLTMIIQSLLIQYPQMIRDSMTQFDVSTEVPQPTLTFPVQSGQNHAVGQA